jgi:hypothetical protein
MNEISVNAISFWVFIFLIVLDVKMERIIHHRNMKHVSLTVNHRGILSL